MRKYIVIFILLIIATFSKAQDMHYSQFYTMPLYINPALCGSSSCLVRAGLNYRDQWTTISVPFKTESVYLDTKWTPKFMRGDWFGIGANVYNDNAGIGNLQSTKIMLDVAYHKGMDKKGGTIVSIGASLGYVMRHVTMSALTFDDQWTGSSFDQTLPSNEPGAAAIHYFDVNAGILFKYQKFLCGFSLNHINKPNNSFHGSLSRVGWKYIFHAEPTFAMARNIKMEPKLYVSVQKMTPEVILGTNFILEYKDVALYLGIWDRTVYDIIPLAGLGYKKIKLLFSYDFNYSKLVPASMMLGGLEISLTLSFKCSSDKQKNRKQKAHCPAYE